jgi:glycine cleavage system aminomethyltransferase T
VPELAPADVAVVLCQADAAAVDALVAPGHRARVLATAPDERLFVCEPAVATDVAREVRDRIAALDDDAIVLDVTDAWSGLRLVGADAPDAFAYLSRLDPPGPDAFVQGHVAHVAAKVLGDPDGLTILVPAYWGAHLWERVRHDTGAREVTP